MVLGGFQGQLQGYPAHEKHPPRGTLQQSYAWVPVVILGGWVFLMSKVLLRRPLSAGRGTRGNGVQTAHVPPSPPGQLPLTLIGFRKSIPQQNSQLNISIGSSGSKDRPREEGHVRRRVLD